MALSTNSVLTFLREKAEKFANQTCVSIKEGERWRSYTYGQLRQYSQGLSSYLMDRGIKKGDRIGLLSQSCPEWAVCFFAAIRAGATLVPLDVKLTEAELVSILSDCQPVLLFVDRKHGDLAYELKKKLSFLQTIMFVDTASDEEARAVEATFSHEVVAGVERDFSETALIVYTSGTTGNPKGVMISFGSLIFEVNSFEAFVDLSEKDKFLSILPPNHLFELTGGFLGILAQGGSISYCHSIYPQEILKAFREQGITGMMAVPLFLKALKNGLERDIKKQGEEVATRFKQGLEAAGHLPLAERRGLFADLHSQLGGKLRVFVSGGAPLEADVAEFFELLGIAVLQGYGLTETSPVITVNSLNANKLGSVGKPLDDVELKVDKRNGVETEGEILTRGPHIMQGYYKRPDLTREVIDEAGWLHTGDMGHIDDQGFLYITGRLKNMIVLGGGKKIFPEEVEAALETAQAIKEIVVLGRKIESGFKGGTEEVIAVVVPADHLVTSHQDAAAIAKVIKEELNTLAQNLAPYKRPTRIVIHNEELPKTATRKVKRPLVSDWLDEHLD